MSLEQNQKILSSDINDLILRIETEIKKRNKRSCPQGTSMYGNSSVWTHYGWGSNNAISSTNNSNIHISWKCKKNYYYGDDGDTYYCYESTANGVVRLQVNQIYDEYTTFRSRSEYVWVTQAGEDLESLGCLERLCSIDMPSIASGMEISAEDVNTLIELLNVINTDTYWNTSTAVTAGELIQTIIEMSNTLNRLENNTVSVKSSSSIQTDQQAGIGSPLGNTSGCNSACKGLCQSCLGTATSDNSGGGGDDCGSGGSGDDGCSGDCTGSGCSGSCQGGCQGGDWSYYGD